MFLCTILNFIDYSCQTSDQKAEREDKMFTRRIIGIRKPVSFLPPYPRNNLVFQNLAQKRTFKLSAPAFNAVKGWGTVVNIAAGAYIGGLLICLGLLAFMYNDANDRQNIPFELSFNNQITAVKAINKDDVLKSPRYANKHYRRLLIELARESDPGLDFDESLDENKYNVPLIDSKTLMYKKSTKFSNFYIDIVLRYAKTLLAKGQLETSVNILKKIIDDDELFYNLGDAERLSQCCRLISKVSNNNDQKLFYLERSIDMLSSTFSFVHLDKNYLLEDQSTITDELFTCLNELAFGMAKTSTSKSISKKEREEFLSRALNIYLANLKTLTKIKHFASSAQVRYPLFNCDSDNITMSINEIKAHIAEILWAKGFKQNAISWSEEVVEDIYFTHSTSARASPILISVLNNLITMYGSIKDIRSKKRCEALRLELNVFESEEPSWYDSVIERFSNIIYQKGPLGIIEKALSERFGSPKRVPLIEEYEEEDLE